MHLRRTDGLSLISVEGYVLCLWCRGRMAEFDGNSHLRRLFSRKLA